MSIYSTDNILFIDIETVPQTASYDQLPEPFQRLWEKKAGYLDKEKEPKELYEQRGGIYAEYGKIIVISLGFFSTIDGKSEFRTKSFANHNEKELLIDFCDLLGQKFEGKFFRFCAHNGKEFDYPYICRRLLVNELPIPKPLQIMGKKPWEVPHLDTLELWKFGDYKHFTSLETLTTIFDIPTSKEDIDGSQVAEVYYKENDLERITTYCVNDVIATARVFLKLMNLPPLENEAIIKRS